MHAGDAVTVEEKKEDENEGEDDGSGAVEVSVD